MIGDLACQDITTAHMQQIVNAAPTPGEDGRVQGMISALAGAGIAGGYLASPRLKEVHWQAGERPLPAPQVSVAGESPLFVDPTEIPASADVARLGQPPSPGKGKRQQGADTLPVPGSPGLSLLTLCQGGARGSGGSLPVSEGRGARRRSG